MPAHSYSNLFTMGSRRIPYIPLLASKSADGTNCFAHFEVDIEPVETSYSLPPEFQTMPLPQRFQDSVDAGVPLESFRKCRLESFTPTGTPPDFKHRLKLRVSPTCYLDYLRSGQNLDKEIPNSDPVITFRQKFMPDVAVRSKYADSPLTNICGVGLFLITSDNKLIIAQNSHDVSVFPNRCSYAASGTIDWNPYPNPFQPPIESNPEWRAFLHPFNAIHREAKEEINHDVFIDKTALYAIGIDAEKLYFQFSFFERSFLNSEEVLSRAPEAPDFAFEKKCLEAHDFNLSAMVRLVKSRDWEPAAEAALITLTCREFGAEEVEWAMDEPFAHDRVRRSMHRVWDDRARRPDVRAVMSMAYPSPQCQKQSDDYVAALMSFIGTDMNNAGVLEVGCGIGRITAEILDRTSDVTCIDVSPEMLSRCRKALGNRIAHIDFFEGMAQDFPVRREFDCALCSLVLIHNVHDPMYRLLIEKLHLLAKTVFIAEHVDGPRTPSVFTKCRTTEELIADFLESGFTLEKQAHHMLFDDRIAFLKFVRCAPSPIPSVDPTPSPEQPHDAVSMWEGGFVYRRQRYKLQGMQWSILNRLVQACPHAVRLEALAELWGSDGATDATIRTTVYYVRRSLRKALSLPEKFDPIPRENRGAGLTCWRLDLPVR